MQYKVTVMVPISTEVTAPNAGSARREAEKQIRESISSGKYKTPDNTPYLRTLTVEPIHDDEPEPPMAG